MTLLLAIDVGNTHTVLGVFDGEVLTARWRVRTQAQRTADEFGVLLSSLFHTDGNVKMERVEAAIVSSVVPALTSQMVTMGKQLFGVRCRVVGPGLKTGMPILYEDPREVGADRIVNAVAAYEKWPRGLIIVDFGTATTFDVVSPEGEYLGGSICPGIGISSDALFRNAARLPKVEFARPKSVVGRNTVSSIQSGLVYGYVSMVEGLIQRIEDEVDFECQVVATGGLARRISQETDLISHVDEDLTLRGLKRLDELNR